MTVHVPVLLREVMDLLSARNGMRHVDATVNGGGHAAAVLEACAPDGRVLGIDRDPDLIATLEERFATEVRAGRFIAVHGNFRNLTTILRERDFLEVDSVLLDLGLSSYHLDVSGRGFTFRRDEPLDLRFDHTHDSPDAAELLATSSVEELTEWFRTYGEERFASRIARTITARRRERPVITSADLLDAVRASLPAHLRWRAERSAARIFQALRIVVNAELESLRAALPQALDVLVPGGRLVVISFHSLEDRIVKTFFREQAARGHVQILTKKPLTPSEEEIVANPRAASAKLRAAKKS